jgi:hypothetical protein
VFVARVERSEFISAKKASTRESLERAGEAASLRASADDWISTGSSQATTGIRNSGGVSNFTNTSSHSTWFSAGHRENRETAQANKANSVAKTALESATSANQYMRSSPRVG